MRPLTETTGSRDLERQRRDRLELCGLDPLDLDRQLDIDLADVDRLNEHGPAGAMRFAA